MTNGNDQEDIYTVEWCMPEESVLELHTILDMKKQNKKHKSGLTLQYMHSWQNKLPNKKCGHAFCTSCRSTDTLPTFDNQGLIYIP